MNRRCHGELAQYEQSFKDGLHQLGYTERSITRQLGMLVHLDRWLEEQGVAAHELSADVPRERRPLPV